MPLSNGRSHLFLLLLLLLLAACSRSDGLTIDCHLFEDNPDQTATLAVQPGAEFSITLCVKRNRGYRWSEELQISNPDIVQELDRSFEPGKSPMGGVAGQESWTFRALAPGQATIRMDHTQISGRNTEGTWTYQLDLTVETGEGGSR